MNTRTASRTRQGLRAMAAAVALTLAGGAMAQGFPGGPGRDGFRGHDAGPGQRFERGNHADRYNRSDRYEHRNGWRAPQRFGPRPHVEWHRGGYLPAAYRAPQYVVNDWQAYHLQAPPSGYRWMQVNGDFVLGAIAGGLIAAIVAGQ